jgi:hypothetical protein
MHVRHSDCGGGRGTASSSRLRCLAGVLLFLAASLPPSPSLSLSLRAPTFYVWPEPATLRVRVPVFAPTSHCHSAAGIREECLAPNAHIPGVMD